MSDEELRECRDWFEGTARKMGALEWDQIMGSGRLMFIAFARADGFIYPEDMHPDVFTVEGSSAPSAEVLFLCAQIGTEPAALAGMISAIASVADRNHDGKISAQEFLMVWTVFCHFTIVENIGEVSTPDSNDAEKHGAANDTLERIIFDLADTDASGFVDFEELVVWVDVLLALNLVPDEDRVIIQGNGIMRANTAVDIARKYMARFDVNDDRILSREEFIELSQGLRLKSTISEAVSVRKKGGRS
jgi:Ca2+-binding EF-hand superfamily protein